MFPELRLCEPDWKAEQIAIENYPSWHQNHFKERNRSTKPEAEDITVGVDPGDEVAPIRNK